MGFAAFGWFWGTWGAALPAVQDHSGASEGALGVALLCIAAGALAAMRPMGTVVDRLGDGVLPAAIVAFAAMALLPAVAGSALALSAALLLLGAASGSMDVAVNSEAVRAEAGGRPLMNLAHGAFSASVVGASLLTGGLRSAGADLALVLGAAAAMLVLAALATRLLEPAPHGRRAAAPARMLRVPAPLAILGGLTALAFFVENAWQSWSAVHLQSTLGASPALASLGPAIFAAAAATGRLAGHPLSQRVAEHALVAAGAAVAAVGTLIGATASGPLVALAGIGLAGLGTSVCAPTLIGIAGRISAAGERGSAVSIVTTIAYLGFLVGPAAVGLAAQTASLTTALAGVAMLAAALAAGARFAPTRAQRPKPRGPAPA